jgi:steroid delta-isomerase-like uncharacterized protein
VSEQIKARVRQFYDEVVNGGDLDRVEEFCTEDFVDHEEFPGIPPTRDGVRQFFGLMREAFPDFRVDIEDLIVEGDRVAVRMTMSGTQQGEFMGVPATGRRFSVDGVDILRMEGSEQAAEHWGVTDVMSLMQQLGATAAQTPA